MTKFNLHDEVRLADKSLEPEVPLSALGCIVDAEHSDYDFFMVEFFDLDFNSLGVFDVCASQLILVSLYTAT